MPKAKVMAMAERTTVGTSASGSANATGYDSSTVPTFKPHRSKAEILTEIVSDNLIRFALVNCATNKSLVVRFQKKNTHQKRFAARDNCCQSYVFFFSFFFFFLWFSNFFHAKKKNHTKNKQNDLDAFGTKKSNRNSVGSYKRRNLRYCSRHIK